MVTQSQTEVLFEYVKRHFLCEDTPLDRTGGAKRTRLRCIYSTFTPRFGANFPTDPEVYAAVKILRKTLERNGGDSRGPVRLKLHDTPGVGAVIYLYQTFLYPAGTYPEDASRGLWARIVIWWKFTVLGKPTF